jgi:hypothetical protein
MTGRSRFDPRRRRKDFPLASVSRPALGPTYSDLFRRAQWPRCLKLKLWSLERRDRGFEFYLRHEYLSSCIHHHHLSPYHQRYIVYLLRKRLKINYRTISIRFILILSSSPCLGLPSGERKRQISRPCVTSLNMLLFLRWEAVSPIYLPPDEGLPLVGCPRLFIEYMRSFPTYL